MPLSYGKLSEAQAKVLARHVKGRVVHDLGAGWCALAVEIAQLGAKKVIAVDKDQMPPVREPKVHQRRGYFGCVAADMIDVGFTSWPQVEESVVLLRLLEHARTVVYLGKNTDMTSCGWPELFRSFLHRRVVEYVPEKPNTLIVYGEKLARPRAIGRAKGEERAAIVHSFQSRRRPGFKPVTFEEVEAHADAH